MKTFTTILALANGALAVIFYLLGDFPRATAQLAMGIYLIVLEQYMDGNKP